MADTKFSWIDTVKKLQPAALTVRAQALSPNDNGTLYWDVFFPPTPVASIRLSEIYSTDDRPVSDRREWNGPGRRIPLVIPAFRGMEMVPIEATDEINEYEMQILSENAFGNEDIIQQQLGVRIPDRTDRLAQANYRRVEMDAFSTWQYGKVLVRNPQDGKAYETSFGYDASRYPAAGTAWSDPSLNAYDSFIAFMEGAKSYIGEVEGSVQRLAVIKEIQKDAPTLANNVKMTRADLASRIEDDLGHAFRFVEMENGLDVFVDGGTAKVRTKVWNSGRIAALPAGGIVGSTCFAPVVRAMDLAKKNQEARIDIRDNAVFIDTAKNGGKSLGMEVQMNALTIPNEQAVYVMDTGIAVP